jgi:hypothetical protein
MKDLEEQHVCMEFSLKLATTFTETFLDDVKIDV